MPTETLAPAVGAPVEIVTPITPAEAFRLGRLLFPVRIENDLFDGENGACAAGAIMAGVGLEDDFLEDAAEIMPILNATGCPTEHCSLFPLSSSSPTITHLNDYHHWSDTQMIAYLEGNS